MLVPLLANGYRELASVVESADPLLDVLSKSAAVGGVLWLALEMRKEDPEWDRALAVGSVVGALAGAVLIVVDMTGVG